MVDFHFASRIDVLLLFSMLRIVEYILANNILILCCILRLYQWLVIGKQLLKTLCLFGLCHCPISDWHVLLLKAVYGLLFRYFRRLASCHVCFGVILPIAHRVSLEFFTLVIQCYLLVLMFVSKGIFSGLLDNLSPSYVLPSLVGYSPQTTIVVVWIVQFLSNQF